MDAGSIEGKLELNNEGFTGSMLEAEGIARIFPEVVTDFLASPLLGFAEIAKTVGEQVIDTFKEIQQDAEDVGLASMKLGVSPEFFSTWAAIGKTVQVGTEQMTAGFRFLELHAQEALEGSKTAQKGFNDLGISMQELRVHQGDVAWMWDHIRAGMDALPTGQARILAGQELMGRGGAALLPVLRMTSEHIDELRRKFIGFGDEVDGGEARTAQKFQDLETVAGWAVEGIGKSFEKPVFNWFGEHADEIMGKVSAAAMWLIGDVNKLWTSLKSDATIAELHHFEDVAVQGFGKVKEIAKEVWGELNGAEAKEAIANIEDFGKQLIEDLPKVTKIAADAAKVLTDMLKAGQEELHGKMPKDDFTSGIGKSLAQIIVPAGLDTTGPRQMGVTPEARKALENYIHDQLGIDVPKGTTDQELGPLMERAQRHAAQGVDPSSSDAPAPSPQQAPPRYSKSDSQRDMAAEKKTQDESMEIIDKMDAGTATKDDFKRFSQLQDLPSKYSGGSGVSIGAVNITVTPDTTAAQIGKHIKNKIDQAQSRANLQSSIGGG